MLSFFLYLVMTSHCLFSWLVTLNSMLSLFSCLNDSLVIISLILPTLHVLSISSLYKFSFPVLMIACHCLFSRFLILSTSNLYSLSFILTTACHCLSSLLLFRSISSRCFLSSPVPVRACISLSLLLVFYSPYLKFMLFLNSLVSATACH
jgi:hypothetical protein